MRRIAVTRLAAGFGNRLFQIAAALEVVGSDLDRVRVHGKTGEKAVRMEAERMQTLEHVLQRRLGQASRSAQRLNKRLGKYGYVALAEDGRRTSREPRDPLERSVYGRITRFGMSYYLHGLFQDPRWSPEGTRALVERIVECRPAEVLKVLPTAGHAVVSIRGGDYAPLGWMLDDDYLEGAIDAGILSGQEMVLIVGADGRANEHARQLLARHGISSSPVPTTSNALEALVMDFWAIATARSVVMSNSTFCWWAARVGETVTPEQTVTYPAGWVTGDPDHLLSRTLLLPRWRPLASSCVAPAAD